MTQQIDTLLISLLSEFLSPNMLLSSFSPNNPAFSDPSDLLNAFSLIYGIFRGQTAHFLNPSDHMPL